MPHPLEILQQQQNRRTFLRDSSLGLGSVALSTLLTGRSQAATQPGGGLSGLADLPHFAPRAKRVIFLCMAGGPSHLETFDYKPKLLAMDGQPMPESFTSGQPIAQPGLEQRLPRGPIDKV